MDLRKIEPTRQQKRSTLRHEDKEKTKTESKAYKRSLKLSELVLKAINIFSSHKNILAVVSVALIMYLITSIVYDLIGLIRLIFNI
jgi:hypothetical protein